MDRPIVVMTSPDERLGREISGLLSESCELRITTHAGYAQHLLQSEPVQLLVIDNGDSAAEVHSIRRLAEVAATLPQPPKVLLFSSSANIDPANSLPESLDVHFVEGPRDGQSFAEQIQAIVASEEDAERAPEPMLHRETDGKAGAAFGEMVFEGTGRRFETRSPELKQMLEDLMIAGGHDVTILLIGETGSGKTFLSNLVHEASPRRNEPFVHVACGALPRDIIESELFGHVKGAFTSAHADKDGKFVAARRGTILLDEIDVLGPEQQVKLLRVIETGEFEPVGSNRTMRSQARLVVASNLDLEPLVEQGRFRPDLYYRLNMLKFEIPPLRKRKVDIIPLAKKFIAKFQQKHSVAVHRIEDSVLEALLSYPWPGNVRELEHVIQRAVIYCRNGVLTRDQLPSHLLSGRVGPTNDPSVRLGSSLREEDQSLEEQVALTEKDIIEQALFKNNFSRTKTAKDLGISRVTLYNKMKKYEMLKQD